MISCLDRLLAGDATARDRFAIEERISVGQAEDRLVVDGHGLATFTRTRAPGDAGGAGIGTWRTTLDAALLTAVVQQLEAVLAGPPLQPGRAEPQEVRLSLGVLADGHVLDHVTGARPEQRAAIQGLQAALGRVKGAVLEKPLRVARAELESLEVGKGTVRSVLKLVNPGTEGAWITHPLAARGEAERVELAWVELPEVKPGVQAIRNIPESVPALPVGGTATVASYLWLAPGAAASFTFESKLALPKKRTSLRLELFLAQGPLEIAGQPRIRGSLFSDEKIVEPRA